MTKRFLLSVVTVFCFVLSYGAPSKVNSDQRIVKIEEELSLYRHAFDSLEYRQSCLVSRVESAESLMEHHLAVISNELSASDRFLGFFGLFLTLLAIGLGVYVTWMQSRVKRISEQVDKKSKEIEEIQNHINSGFDEFYKKIRRTDTANYVKRLESVPMDVANIIDIMLVRELEAEDFDVLKSAFKKLVELGKENEIPRPQESTSYGAKYCMLFFQFFLGNSIRDDFLRERIRNRFSWLVNCCFEVDIKKAMSDVAPVLHQTGVAFDRVALLKDLLLALRGSAFKNNTEVFAILQNGIADDELWKAANDMAEKADGMA